MEAFEPVINLLVLMTVLSMACERITNVFKLKDQQQEADREVTKEKAAAGKPGGPPPKLTRNEEAAKKSTTDYKVSLQSILWGIALAILAKANIFEILNNLQDPWATLGWVRLEEYSWVRSPASASFGRFIYTLGGCLITGVGLGFGNKFWHDLLETAYQVKKIAREKEAVMKASANKEPEPATVAASPPAPPAPQPGVANA